MHSSDLNHVCMNVMDLRTRGSRKKWWSSGFEDGEGIAILFQREWGVLYSCLDDSMFCIIDSGFGISCLGCSIHYHRDICIDARLRLFWLRGIETHLPLQLQM